jgi:dynein heavy chain, axonemal
MNRKVYRYINRGLFERDKITFKLLMASKILIKAGTLTSADIGLLLKAGGGIDDRNNPFASWMAQKNWLNLKALSKHKFGNDHSMFFKELPDRINRNEQVWKKWVDEAEPENIPVPDYEEKISSDQTIGHFIHLCLVRSIREDRTLLACQQFISATLGNEYGTPITDQIADLYEETKPDRPVLYLLSKGADPTSSIDEFAKKKK